MVLGPQLFLTMPYPYPLLGLLGSSSCTLSNQMRWYSALSTRPPTSACIQVARSLDVEITAPATAAVRCDYCGDDIEITGPELREVSLLGHYLGCFGFLPYTPTRPDPWK